MTGSSIRRRSFVAFIAALAMFGGLGPMAADGATCEYPAQALDLTNWKVQLPTGSASKPTEIKQPQLATSTSPPWFGLIQPCNGAYFRAPVNGVTTSGSRYPRSELREMTNNGTQQASWSSTEGTHTMVVNQAIIKVPTGRPVVVAGQIHDAVADITMLRLDGTRLYITNGDITRYKLITARYRLGKPFELKYVVGDGQIRVFYNGVLQATIDKSFTGAYFKAGAYPQANCTNASPCDDANVGQVLIYDLAVTHD